MQIGLAGYSTTYNLPLFHHIIDKIDMSTKCVISWYEKLFTYNLGSSLLNQAMIMELSTFEKKFGEIIPKL